MPGEDINLEDQEWTDINIVTGCLKLYLRELPDPIIPFKMFRSFIDAASKYSVAGEHHHAGLALHSERCQVQQDMTS